MGDAQREAPFASAHRALYGERKAGGVMDEVRDYPQRPNQSVLDYPAFHGGAIATRAMVSVALGSIPDERSDGFEQAINRASTRSLKSAQASILGLPQGSAIFAVEEFPTRRRSRRTEGSATGSSITFRLRRSSSAPSSAENSCVMRRSSSRRRIGSPSSPHMAGRRASSATVLGGPSGSAGPFLCRYG